MLELNSDHYARMAYCIIQQLKPEVLKEAMSAVDSKQLDAAGLSCRNTFNAMNQLKQTPAWFKDYKPH